MNSIIYLNRLIGSMVLLLLSAIVGFSQTATNQVEKSGKRPTVSVTANSIVWVLSEGYSYYTDYHPQAKTNTVNTEWGKPVAGYALSIAASDKIFAPGKPIMLNLSRKNVGEQDLPVTLAEIPVLYAFKVTAADEDVPMNSFGKNIYGKPKSISSMSEDLLRPGEKTLEEIPLSQFYDLSPGKYKVSVSMMVSDYRNYKVVVVSNVDEIIPPSKEAIAAAKPPGLPPWVKVVSNEIEVTVGDK